MRGLLQKYPLGYGGYVQEKEMAATKRAFTANATVGVEPAVEAEPLAGIEPVIAHASVAGSAPDTIKPSPQGASSVVT